MRTLEQKQRRNELERINRQGVSGDKLRNYQKEYMQKRRKETPEKCLYNKEEKRKYDKIINLRKRYNLSFEQWLVLLEQSKGLCGICGIEFDMEITCKRGIHSNYPRIDHNHDTDEIRGLLCNKCNTALGLFKEDIDTIKKAIKWLGG